MTIKLLEKIYTAEQLADADRDVYECFDPLYNAAVVAIPQDENGFHMGHFKITVEWIDG